MHFCRANGACCGDDFSLTRLTEKEQRTLDELNSVFSQLSVDDATDTTPAIDKAEELKAIEDRMLKLKELMKRLPD